MGINKAILIGNLGKDPELKYLPSQQPVVNFTLATTERYTSKDGQRQDRTEWHNIVAFGKLAEIANQYLKKGRSAYVEGRIQTRSWNDQDNNKKFRTEIVALVIEFLGGPQGGSGSPTRSQPAVQPAVPAPADDAPMPAQEPPVAEDDLPF